MWDSCATIQIVLCPSCEVELQSGRCPQCGAVFPSPPNQRGTSTPISFSVATSRTSEPPPPAVDWRDELRMKLRRHHSKKLGQEPESPTPRPSARTWRLERAARRRSSGAPTRSNGLKSAPETKDAERTGATQESQIQPGGQPGEQVKQLFKYKLDDSAKFRDRRIITFAKSKLRAPVTAEKPVIRHPPPPPPSKAAPRQKQLALEPAASESVGESEAPAASAASPAVAAKPSVVETLFSRLLAGIVDSVLALALGFAFAFAAARLSGAPFPSTEGLIVALVCGWTLLVLNEIFFLVTLGRTPGMMCTELHLVDESGQGAGFRGILIRTLLWVPVLVTLVGLAWALFDSQGRCLHDRISRTRVVSMAVSS